MNAASGSDERNRPSCPVSLAPPASRMAAVWSVSLPLLLSGMLACTGCQPGAGQSTQSAAAVQLRGAGATFPAPLYEKWIEVYGTLRADVAIDYEAVGSGEGIQRFMAETVDFGASDAALSDEQMANVERGVQLVPTTAGSIVLAYNLPAVSGKLRLSREVYTSIFLGEITQWNDPRIQECNPQLELPKRDISVVARLDSSGTTFAFTNHLSAVSTEWRDRGPGVGKLIDWPGSAMLARGNEGVAGLIKRTPGALGYVEYGIASRTGLSMAELQNKAGSYVSPTGASGMATLVNTELPANLRAFFPDPAGNDSYPIVTYTWLLLYQQYDDTELVGELKAFVEWCLTEGQNYNEELGFIRLPPQCVEATLAALRRVAVAG